MKSNYILRRVNSPFDDSGVFARNIYMKKAVLFDCGRLSNVDNSELNDIAHIFVTHTHIDHFNGFDRFLRTSLLSGNTFTFYGPSGFIRNVEGRLASYTWNLIKDYNIVFKVVELTKKGNFGALFAAQNGFKKEEITIANNIELEDGFSLEYEFFDHGITSLGYRLKEPLRISINKEKMEEYGFQSGSWLKVLKDYLLNNNSNNEKIDVATKDGVKSFYVKEMASLIAEYPEPQDITYITDIAPSYDNYKKAVKLSYNSYLLLIEAVFMNNDISHSIEKKHLSIGVSKLIYNESKSKYVSFGHFAPKYDRMKDIFFNELYKDINKSNIIKNEIVR